jgi:hypothetical protein
MTRLWPTLLGAAQVVQPETILRWHRASYAGLLLAVVAVCVLVVTPGRTEKAQGSIWAMFAPYKVVLKNPQSYLCGLSLSLTMRLEAGTITRRCGANNR